MSGRNVIDFLRFVAAQPGVLETLRVRSKDQVIAAAGDFGFPFTEPEFNTVIWDLEVALAARRGEAFDARFPLWHLMWGRYYLEYLAIDLIPALQAAHVDTAPVEGGRTT
ncbi:MAG TPA: Nif11-like leader peptide family natural product precursor [Candidatus Dormibacteraeota bacterium]